MASLIHMQKILANRMQHFSTIEKAVYDLLLFLFFFFLPWIAKIKKKSFLIENILVFQCLFARLSISDYALVTRKEPFILHAGSEKRKFSSYMHKSLFYRRKS